MNLNPSGHIKRVQNYYKFHSRIYDASRWVFLFGRNKLLNLIPPLPPQPRILEVGCGTGRNLKKLERKFPQAKITGVDISGDMLKVAEKTLKDSKQVHITQTDYFSDNIKSEPFDLILLSYSLTMFGGQEKDILEHITQDLKPNGCLATVDFNTSPVTLFRRWMEMNHVNFSGQFLPSLQSKFYPVETEVNLAYFGLWSYFLFVGRRE